MNNHRKVRPPIEVLWNPNTPGGERRRPGWSFPRVVEKKLLALTEGKRVLHPFGGDSRWGTRLDIDATTRPHVRGDAFLLPFGRSTFDVTILDPPYERLNAQTKTQLLRQAAYVSREYVIWFHTIWIYSSKFLPMERAWLVRVGDNCQIRCLQIFRVTGWKEHPEPFFTRGPAMKYNRWLSGAMPLPFARELVEG